MVCPRPRRSADACLRVRSGAGSPDWRGATRSLAGAVLTISALADPESRGAGFWCLLISAWLSAWLLVERLSDLEDSDGIFGLLRRLVIPVLFGVWLIYFSFGLCIASMGPLVTEIAVDLDASRSSMGAVLGAWQLTYIAAALPLGAALDRIGVAKGLVLSAAVMVAANVSWRIAGHKALST